MISLTLGAILFAGVHLLMSGTRLRGHLVDRIGERGFRGLFALLSVAGMVWLCWAYAYARYTGLWGPVYWFRPIALVLMLLAFEFVAIGITTPSPTARGGESLLGRDEAATGILRITRHPLLWGLATWAFVHLLMSGDAASLVFFGTFLLVAFAGQPSIDARRREACGEKWDRFAAATSSLPFAAIVQGRNSLRLGELQWRGIALGAVLYIAFLILHPWLFGVSALPA